MSDKEHPEAPDDTDTDTDQDDDRTRDEKLGENAGEAFRDIYEPGPRVHTSSRPLDETNDADDHEESDETVSADTDTDDRSTTDNRPAEAAPETEPADGYDDTDTAADGSGEPTSTQESGDDAGETETEHTRELDGEPAETPPVSELDLGMEDLEQLMASESSGQPTEEAEPTTESADEPSGLLGRFKALLFGR